jgi:hypothetical protein
MTLIERICLWVMAAVLLYFAAVILWSCFTSS